MTKEMGQLLKPGAVVQIDPSHDDIFGGCLMVVSEVKSFGFMGYVRVPGEDHGNAWYRVAFDAVEPVGMATWVLP